MSCALRGRSGSPVLSGAHLEQNAHRTAGKALFRFYKVVYGMWDSVIVGRILLDIFTRNVAVKADSRSCLHVCCANTEMSVWCLISFHIRGSLLSSKPPCTHLPAVFGSSDSRGSLWPGFSGGLNLVFIGRLAEMQSGRRTMEVFVVGVLWSEVLWFMAWSLYKVLEGDSELWKNINQSDCDIVRVCVLVDGEEAVALRKSSSVTLSCGGLQI